MKKLFSILLIFAMITFSGCYQKSPDAEQKTIVVSDGCGRTVKLPEKVNRIVTNYGIAAHMVFVLGEWQKLVGIDDNSKRGRFLNAVYPRVASMESTGGAMDINIEQTLSLQPDLILVAGNNKILLDRLAACGLPVFGVIAENLEQIGHTVYNLGKALNREKIAAQYIAYYNATLDLVSTRLKNLSEEKKPLVFLVGPMGVLSTCTRDMYQHSLIEACGGKNAGGMLKGTLNRHGWTEIPAEKLIKWDPDVILIVQYSTTTPEKILKDQRWQKIKAVKNKKVYFFPSCFCPWDYPSPQAVLGIRWLAVTLYPKRFGDMDILKETNSFYKTFYGKTFSEYGGKI